MTIHINGEEQTIEKDEILVTELLKLKNVEMPEMVSVELNGDFLEREKYNSTFVKKGDEVEFLYFMGGGSI